MSDIDNLGLLIRKKGYEEGVGDRKILEQKIAELEEQLKNHNVVVEENERLKKVIQNNLDFLATNDLLMQGSKLHTDMWEVMQDNSE